MAVGKRVDAGRMAIVREDEGDGKPPRPGEPRSARYWKVTRTASVKLLVGPGFGVADAAVADRVQSSGTLLPPSLLVTVLTSFKVGAMWLVLFGAVAGWVF